MKIVLITGVTAGIGAAAARKFASAGWQVIGTGRRAERLDGLAQELGGAFRGLELDMRDIGALNRMASELGPVDLLVNNAGLAPPMSGLQDAEQAPIDTVIDTNISGLVALTRALLPGLIERKGAVINLSSVAATYPYKGGAVYAGSKAFVRQFSLGLRCDLAGTGVRVTSIEPGMVETEFTLVRTNGDQAASDALYTGANPMTAEDIADTIFYVASLPPHLNINALELMPVSRELGGVCGGAGLIVIARSASDAAIYPFDPIDCFASLAMTSRLDRRRIEVFGVPMTIDTRLAELGITLPAAAAPVASYVPYVEANGLLYISGQISFADDGSLIMGRLGEDMDLDAGIAAARRCGIMLLAQLRNALGSLDRVERIVKLGVFVNSAGGFTDQPKVANGASELMQDVFGEAGRHARSAVGVPVLPLGVAVEVDAIVQIKA